MKKNKNLALKISTLVVVSACFIVMLATFVVAQNFKNLLTLWGEDVQLTVYLEPEISIEDEKTIEDFLKSTGKVSSIEFISQERALLDFKVRMASYAPDIAQDQELLRLVPASLLVRLSGQIPTDQQMATVKQLAESVKDQEGVDEVSYGQEWIEKYSALVTTIEIIFRFLGLVIVGAAIFVISNAIRASVHNRKEEIGIMEMIGATTLMIRKPFLLEGALLGFNASILAVGSCFFAFLRIRSLILDKLNFLQLGTHLQFMTVGTVMIFIVAGALMGALASYLCVRKINDGYSGAQT
jgi:cell division transport system permease protein